MGNEPCLTWNVLIKYNFNNILKETRIKNNKKKKKREKKATTRKVRIQESFSVVVRAM